MTAVLKINEELNGIELYFANKPKQEVLTDLKSNGFRWSAFKKCWYTKQNERALQIANNLTNNTTNLELPEVKTAARKQSKKVETFNLWNATQLNSSIINKALKNKECKEIAKEIRSHMRKQFPNCKFSVTTGGSYLHSTIDISIKSSPYEKGSTYLNAIREYGSKLLSAYRVTYSESDPYTDYAGSYNFYGHSEISWEYVQTEATEEIKKDMLAFDSKLAEAEAAEQAKKEAEYQAYLAEQEARNAEYEKRQAEQKKQKENIYNSIDIVELEENGQYFVTGSEFADLNKNNTLDQYKAEVEKGKYSLENVKITKEIHFSSKEALENFSSMLLHDFDFLTNTGGSFTEDNRIKTMTDYYNMEDYEKKTVQWSLYGVAIFFDGKLQFVVDAQGYSYARYVGLTDNATIVKTVTTEQIIQDEEITELKQQADKLEDISVTVIEELNIMETWQKENWREYKEALKAKLKDYNFKLTKEIIQQLDIEELKQCMYKILIEVDGIQDQFTEANIQKGEKVTMFYISDWGSIVTNRMTFDSAINSSYAQYDNAVKVTFTPENKRKLHYKYFHSTVLVYKGWFKLPEEVLHHIEVNEQGTRITRSKYSSCDHMQYDEILAHFEQQNIKPVINTYMPRF